jgi:hypothetical protein
LSSAILYLAIVAIWACVLVPRWLRRSHVVPSDPEVLSGQDQADQGEYELSDEFVPGGPGAGTDFAEPGEEDAAAYADPVAWESPAAAIAPEGGTVGASYSITASYYAEVAYSAETETGGSDVPVGDVAPDSVGAPAAYGGPGADGQVAYDSPATERVFAHGDPAAHGSDTYGDAPVADGEPAAVSESASGRGQPLVPMRPPGPPPHVLQARRRTLTLIIAITIAALGAAFIGLTPWWACAVPFVLLGMYLLLLREAANADAERARNWVAAQAQAAEAAREAELERERARQADVAPPPQPTAEIINLSELAAQAKDQIYDQYADADIRAVGD